MRDRERVTRALKNPRILGLEELREALETLGDMSIDEVVGCLLDLPENRRAVVIVDDKNKKPGSSPHAGRRSCVICKGAVTDFPPTRRT